MVMSTDDIYRYHDGTKHHFNRCARSLGFLDWASQPSPFRSFSGAPFFHLFPGPDAPGSSTGHPRVTYDRLFGEPGPHATPITAAAIGDLLRHALGLSAWKVFQRERWSLRVNPSSGNLHPTEAYLVMGALDGVADAPGVWHYAPDRHAIEQRCAFDPEAWRSPAFLLALVSIHWRESWKYGERAFRYCQHDLGHAIGALRLAAALHGWRLTMLPAWPQRAIATLVGLDRDEDYFEAEREEPGCLLLVTEGGGGHVARGDQGPDPADHPGLRASRPDAGLLDAVRQGRWFGRASQLSEDHVEWTFIDEIADATRDLGREVQGSRFQVPGPALAERGIDARRLLLQRRSAVSLDGTSSIDRASFIQLLSRVIAGPGAPWDALWWSPRIHLALFVHRVTGVAPGLYLLARDPDVVPRLNVACDRHFLWEPCSPDLKVGPTSSVGLPLWLLQPGDYRLGSKRVSCDQDIAADGFFSLGMIADFDASLSEYGPSFYRHLFWESGVIGQVLYLEAEAAGARATGIGCFFDDPVHELLGLEGHAFQSLYHFTVGTAVEDARLTMEPGYAWERNQTQNSKLKT